MSTCFGCKHHTKKPRFLGDRPFCKLYKTNRNERCIDFCEVIPIEVRAAIHLLKQYGYTVERQT